MQNQDIYRLIEQFLSIPEYAELFHSYRNSPTKKQKEKLDIVFKQYYKQIRAISYLNKYIYFASIKSDKKIRKHQERYQLIFDKPSDEEGNTTIGELLINEYSVFYYNEIPSEKLEDYFQNPIISNSIKRLTKKQKKILYLSYVKSLKDIEIAKHLRVSQQAITKTRNIALQKIRSEFNA